jgi:hypothetical protein
MCLRPYSAHLVEVDEPNLFTPLHPNRVNNKSKDGEDEVSRQPKSLVPSPEGTVPKHASNPVLEPFIKVFPPIGAYKIDVRLWVKRWFALSDVFDNYIGVERYLDTFHITGYHLQCLSDFGIRQYLEIKNVLLGGGSLAGPLFPREVIEQLIADMLEARRVAIPGWNLPRDLVGVDKWELEKSSEDNKKSKGKDNSSIKTRGSGMWTRRGKLPSSRNENAGASNNSKSSIETNEPDSIAAGEDSVNNVTTALSRLELSSGPEASHDSPTDMSDAKGRGKGKGKENLKHPDQTDS